MSLFGVISRRPVHLQSASSERGWGFVIQQASRKWSKSFERGGEAALAVHLISSEWALFDTANPSSSPGGEMTGDLFLAASTPGASTHGACMLHASPWHFAYEGTIADCEALRHALDPNWVLRDELPCTAGQLIFAHLMTLLGKGGAAFTSDVAMAKAASNLHRARLLGSAAFLCADGMNLYAYSLGGGLLFKNVSDAILVGSPDVIDAGPATRPLQDGALVALAKRPQLGWAVLAHP